MESVECFSCHRKFDDQELLFIHHEFEPCFNSNSSASSNTDMLCPLCNKTFNCPVTLQIHVNDDHDNNPVHSTTTISDSLYAQDLARREQMKNQYEQHRQQSAASAMSYEDHQEDDDARIARMLQEEENAQSFEEFQDRYGGSRKTFSERARWNLDKIYKKKLISQNNYEEYKNKLDEMIAQPTERLESRSTGIIPLLSRLPMGYILERRLCQPSCDHMSSTWLDQGWACGYKNFQMLLSSLRNDPQYSVHLFGPDTANHDIPSVSYLQKLIEKAWSAGFDSEGREQLNGHLVNSSKWIGPTEVMACLANLNIKTELFDFHQPTTTDKSIAYRYLFEWIRNYFRQQQPQQENRNNIIHPLYIQHEGHSRTVVGYEQLRDGQIRLLIFDPSTQKAQIENFLKTPNEKVHIFRRNLTQFKKPVYQILAVRGLLTPDEREAAKHLRSIRVPTPNK